MQQITDVFGNLPVILAIALFIGIFVLVDVCAGIDGVGRPCRNCLFMTANAHWSRRIGVPIPKGANGPS